MHLPLHEGKDHLFIFAFGNRQRHHLIDELTDGISLSTKLPHATSADVADLTFHIANEQTSRVANNLVAVFALGVPSIMGAFLLMALIVLAILRFRWKRILSYKQKEGF